MKVLSKVYEIVSADEQLLKFFRRRIFLYTVTRVLPSVSGKPTDMISTGISIQNLQNMQLFYQGLLNFANVKSASETFKDELELV